MVRAANMRSALAEGLQLHEQGQIESAIERYRQVLAAQPRSVDALHLCGMAERARGRLDEAARLVEQAIALKPRFAEAHGNLGIIRHEQGRLDEAVFCHRRAVALNPRRAEQWFNLGNAERDRGNSAEAIECYRRALKLRSFAEAHQQLADRLLAAGGCDAEAAAHYREALGQNPKLAEAHTNLGTALQRLGRVSEAIVHHHRATQLKPDFAEAHNHLGNCLKDLGRRAEAVACYERALALKAGLVEAWNNLGGTLYQLGRLDDALRACRQALTLKHDFAEAHVNIGNILKVQGHVAEAAHCFQQALAVRPGFAEAHNNLGVVCAETGRHAEAIAHLQQALASHPAFAEAYNNLGNVYKNEGRLDAAIECFQRALELKPDYAGAHSNLLFTLNFVDGVARERLYDLHRDYNARHASPLASHIAQHANAPEPGRRLKVGYISPDFRAHACAFFVDPIFRHHDRTQVEVYAYAEVAHADAVTRRLQGLADHWRSTVGLSDAQVAAQIRADGIDILIDLAGHTANSRLLALARKPAPIQVAYLGYPATTGLDTMDYRLTDARIEPPGTCEAYYTETLVRLPHSLWCYQPFDDMPEISPFPAERNGYLTFGSFNNFAKIGPRVIELWARILDAVPNSRLVMITVPAGIAQNGLRQRFADLGIAAERVELLDRLPRAAYLDLYSRVDVALDPFPCNGGTTTCDALWMGVPVLTLMGETFLSRASYSLLAALGLELFATPSPETLIELAQTLDRDREALAMVRAGLRDQMAASPLLDARGFTRDLEAAYRSMWQRWCAKRVPPVSSSDSIEVRDMPGVETSALRARRQRKPHR
jgi:predicted O-linked N-acetylglucosamine transferase (SPINDLY family)